MYSAGSTQARAPRAFAHCRHRHRSAVLMVVLMATVAAARPAASDRPVGNAVTHWNAVATEAFTPSQGTNPMAQSRTLAILRAAMHDALKAIDRRFEAYTPGLPATPGASVDAAIAAAARDVLVGLLPDQAALAVAEALRPVRWTSSTSTSR